MVRIEFGRFLGIDGLGVVGYTVNNLNEKGLSSKGVVEIVSAIEDHAKAFPKYRQVTLNGFEDEAMETGMYTLCQTLKGYGYKIRAISDGLMYLSWYKLADALTVHVNDILVWTKFPANQVIYRPEENLTKEPDLPPAFDSAWLYLDASELSEDKTLEFLRRSKRTWHLYAMVLDDGHDGLTEVIYEGDLP